MEREVIADFCYQTGPLTQLKKVRQTFTQHTKGKTIIKGGVQIPIYTILLPTLTKIYFIDGPKD